MADFIVLALVAVCLACSIAYQIRRKKNGGSACGCGCAGCGGASCCGKARTDSGKQD
ncbi:MAG: FeoB-associated Cys-rich membrane protein [Lachnospiraceae bacterium]|nr:FeoB-associated Cys-rich membrane protein [Lachnospiraceae bacterium]